MCNRHLYLGPVLFSSTDTIQLMVASRNETLQISCFSMLGCQIKREPECWRECERYSRMTR